METKPNRSYALRGSKPVKNNFIELIQFCCIPFLAAETKLMVQPARILYFPFFLNWLGRENRWTKPFLYSFGFVAIQSRAAGDRLKLIITEGWREEFVKPLLVTRYLVLGGESLGAKG